MVDDINPGASSSSPTPLAVLGGQLVLTANDGIHGSEPMILTTTSQESPPTLATIPTQNVTVGGSIAVGVALYASDPNAPTLPLTYSLGADAPSFANIDPTTGVLSLSPGSGVTPASYTFTLTVTDNGTTPQTASETLTVAVSSVVAPTLDTIDQQFITQGQTFQLNVADRATDANYPAFPLTYSLSPGGARRGDDRPEYRSADLAHRGQSGDELVLLHRQRRGR